MRVRQKESKREREKQREREKVICEFAAKSEGCRENSPTPTFLFSVTRIVRVHLTVI